MKRRTKPTPAPPPWQIIPLASAGLKDRADLHRMAWEVDLPSPSDPNPMPHLSWLPWRKRR